MNRNKEYCRGCSRIQPSLFSSVIIVSLYFIAVAFKKALSEDRFFEVSSFTIFAVCIFCVQVSA